MKSSQLLFIIIVVLVGLVALVFVEDGRYLPANLQLIVQKFKTSTQQVAPKETPHKVPDRLYTWVDDKGVTHYSETPRHGKEKAVTYDDSRLTPLEKVDPSVVNRLKEVAAAEEEAQDKPRGSELLHGVRQEMQENQQKMQQVKQAARESF
mgnify:CR=1 FL=1